MIPARRILVPRELPAGVLLPPRGHEIARIAGTTMGTFWNASWASPHPAEEVRATVESAFQCVVRLMSHWDEHSDLTRYNRAPAGTWHALAPEFSEVLTAALHIAEKSAGAFDPTLGEIADARGHGPALLPSGADPLSRAGWGRLVLDGKRAFQPGGLRLDLSAIAKGHAVDLACRYLNESGVRHFLVEIGGELRGQGCKPDGSPWWVSIGDDGTIAALSGLAVATSGNEYREHLIDPFTGGTAGKGLVSASVFARTCMEADAWATALFVSGKETGLALAENEQLAAVFVDAAGENSWTSAFAAMLE